MSPSILAVVAVALLSSGCVTRSVVRALVPVAPPLAVRVFPEIAVVSGPTPDEVRIADALAEHLARGGRARVERVTFAELGVRCAAGGFGPAAAILHVEVRLQQRREPVRGMGSHASCALGRCGNELERQVAEGTVRLRVSEARSLRVLQELELRARDGAADVAGQRARVIEGLRVRAIQAVDTAHSAVTIVLEDVDDPEARAAMTRLARGQARPARRALERLVRHRSFDVRSPAEQARILFDLGQVLRIEARVPSERVAELDPARLETAERALRRAAALDPRREYHEAIAQVGAEREAQARMREFRDASSANFAMAQPHDVPLPPPGYGYAMRR